MNWADERRVIESYLIQNFSLVPVQVSGQPFNEPPGQAWVKLQITPQETTRITLGPNGTTRVMGVIGLMVFTPPNQGSNQARTVADALDSLFREWITYDPAAGQITCRMPSIKDVGLTSDGTNYQINVTVPYHRDVALTS